MPPEGKPPGKPTSRRYSPEEKVASGWCPSWVSSRVRREVVRFWVRQADLDDGNAPGVSTAESKRIYDLDQEIRRFKRANEILKRAAVASGGVRPPAKEVVGFIDANRGDFGDGAICMGRALGEPEHVQREQASKPVGAARACRTPSWKPASRQLGEDNNRVYVARNCGKPPAAPAKTSDAIRLPATCELAGITGARHGKQVRTTKPAPAAQYPDLMGARLHPTAPKRGSLSSRAGPGRVPASVSSPTHISR